MTTRRRVFLSIAGVLALLVLLIALLPMLFRGTIEARVRQAVNDRVNARVGWTGVGLSLFGDFPNLTLRLDNLAIAGIGAFQGDTLLKVPGLRATVDLGSVLRSLRGSAPIVVRAIELDRPAAHLLVLKDGQANWDIMKPTPGPATPSKGVNVSLKRFDLKDGDIAFENRQAGLTASIVGLTESLDGDFSQTRFLLRTKTAADTLSVRFAGVPYLNRVKLVVQADLDMDMAGKRMAVKDNQVKVNELKLALNGTAAAAPDSAWDLDLTFRAPTTDFREILSLVPAIYARSFASVKTTGTMALSGWVKGRYGPKSFPALALDATVRDATFRYPDLPLPARDIALDLSLTNPGGNADNTVVNLKQAHLVLGANPVDGSFVMRTPVSDPDVDLRVKGTVDLADVARTVKLEKVEQLVGMIAADAAMRARVSDVSARRYERVAGSGTVSARGVMLRAKDLPHAVRVDDALLKLAPQHAELASFHGVVGNSDVSATGFLDNLLSYVLRDEALRGQFKLTSNRFDLNEWRSGGKLQVIPVPADLDFGLDATAATLLYGPMQIHNARGTLQVKDRRLTLQSFTMDMLGGAVAMTGFYETKDTAHPTFDFQMKANQLEVPAAFQNIRTIQAFVPVAGYTKGKASADLRLAGTLGQDMIPVFSVLTALGSFQTSSISLSGFPPMDRLADLLKVPEFRNPGFIDLKSTFEIRNGRLFVKPFATRVGQLGMNVSGSNGIDRSMDYDLALALPRAALGAQANQAVSNILARAGKAGIALQASDVVDLAVKLTGTITNPQLATNLRQVTGSAAAAVGQAVQAEATRRMDTLRARVDTAAAAAQRRAAALVAEAQQRADTIRARARFVADTVMKQANARADSLANRPTNPLAKLAAKAAADRMKKEAQARADAMVKAADAQADSMVATARRQASSLTGQ